MYYEFYIDVFFVVNLLVDFLLLTLTGKTLGGTASLLRIFLAAVAGALGACILTLLWAENPWVVLFHPALAVFMVKTAFKIRSVGKLWRGTFLFYALSFLLGGIFYTIPMGVRKGILWFFTITFTAYGAIYTGIRLWKYLKGREETFCEAVIRLNGKNRKVKGLYDTGNRLRDPLTQKPVCIVEWKVFQELLDQREREVLETFCDRPGDFYLQDPVVRKLKPRLIPYRSVGCETGLLLVVTADGMSIVSGEKEGQVKDPAIGLSKTSLSFDGNFQIIISPAILDSQRGVL